MIYLLDTSACVRIMSGRFPMERTRLLDLLLVSPVFISQIVLFELEYGNEKSLFPDKGRRRLQVFLREGIEVLDFQAQDAEAAARIRAILEARKEPIGPYDTLIAGQALARGLTLVTSNQREFLSRGRFALERLGLAASTSR